MTLTAINKIRLTACHGAMDFLGLDSIKAAKAVRFAIDMGLPGFRDLSLNGIEAAIDDIDLALDDPYVYHIAGAVLMNKMEDLKEEWRRRDIMLDIDLNG